MPPDGITHVKPGRAKTMFVDDDDDEAVDMIIIL